MKNRARLAIAAGLLVSLAQASAWAGPVVSVAQGQIEGRQDGVVNAFLGIPYAAAPVGDLRWRAPAPASAWAGVRDATRFGPSCMQTVLPDGRAPWTHEYVVDGAVSEDCLSLNIWAPAKSAGKKPVLVWIHGGGFNEGSGSVPIYSGAGLAGRDLVVVTINYRLGALGFMAHPDITQEAGNAVAANFGMQDQIAALQWVKKNIAAFGGDAENITIAGQSAGSMAVHTLVNSPLAKGLFVRAIAQSGLPMIMPVPDLAAAEKNGAAFAEQLGAKSLADLRKLPADKFVISAASAAGLRFGLVVDGKLLPAPAMSLIAQGRFNDVPMLVGQTANEGSAFPGYGSGDAAAYQAFLQRSFGKDAAVFSKLYPAQNEPARSRSMKEASGHRGLAMIDAWVSQRQAKGRSPVYAYFYTHAEPGEGADKFGAFHSSEIPYVLSTLDAAPERGFTLADRELSLILSSYWVNFAKTGNPNGKGLAPWSAMTPQKPMVMEFSTKAKLVPVLPADKLKAYRAYAAKGGSLSMF
jgi:para-nitrobenzyl esterase